mmetsp:Transcript_60634/g.195341  ORF Transcript_60634/g.195341 Transcript_60634/m.195341 type:complete len:427 (+) Transcript_60634:144-1424(+)
MPTVEIALGADSYTALDVPDDCTVGNWKKLVGQGFLGDKVLYATKLTCHGEEKGRQLEDGAPLPMPPGKMYVDGPGSVVKMLELALRKKCGPPVAASRPAPLRTGALTSPERSRPAPPPPPPPRSAPAYNAPILAPAQASRTAMPLKSSGSDGLLSFFCAGQQGMRQYMEDRTCGFLQLPGHEHAALFAVFDGHGGHEVAELAVQLLPRILAGALKEAADPAEALKQSFSQLDEEIWNSSSQQRPHPLDRVGSTAVVTLVLQEAGRWRLFCANCGDSRAVLCRQGHAVDLSVDQKPHNPEERRRIEAAGGRVELFGPCWRIDAGLNLSRALGDFAYKANPDKPASEQKVISEPELKEMIIDKEDQFVVMGSDGVFDVLTSEALVLHLRSAQQRGDSWDEAIESALSRSLPGGDNVSLCLVEFLHAA